MEILNKNFKGFQMQGVRRFFNNDGFEANKAFRGDYITVFCKRKYAYDVENKDEYYRDTLAYFPSRPSSHSATRGDTPNFPLSACPPLPLEVSAGESGPSMKLLKIMHTLHKSRNIECTNVVILDSITATATVLHQVLHLSLLPLVFSLARSILMLTLNASMKILKAVLEIIV